MVVAPGTLSPPRGSRRAAGAGALSPRGPELHPEGLRLLTRLKCCFPWPCLHPGLPHRSQVSGERCSLIPGLTGTIKRNKSKFNKIAPNVVNFNKINFNTGENLMLHRAGGGSPEGLSERSARVGSR